jgi:hypothetical protein
VRYELPQPFQDLDHTADVGVAVEGASAEETLARLVLALAALLAGGGPVVLARDERLAVASDGGGLTIEELRWFCGERRSDALRDHCRELASFAEEFTECRIDCRALAGQQLVQEPTR